VSAVKNYLLLTGATGLVGRYLLRDLLLDGRHVAVMARSTEKQSAAERIESILVHWEDEMGVRLNRPVVLEGDLSERDLGLSGDARTWIRRNVIGALHNAAVLHFHGKDPAGEPWRTNVNGVEAFIDFCREADIREMDYVSTAYVCGDREGVIYERDRTSRTTTRSRSIRARTSSGTPAVSTGSRSTDPRSSPAIRSQATRARITGSISTSA
jgi:thioester reductase-like protein